MQPHLVRWDRTYRDRGLAVVYVADGARVTPDKLMDAMRASGAAFPVAHEGSGGTTRAYGVAAYPTAYVIGRDGTVVWEGIPHYDPGAVERAIQSALAAPPGR